MTGFIQAIYATRDDALVKIIDIDALRALPS